MFNYPLKRTRPGTRQKNTEYEMRLERRKPIIPGPYIYVGDFDALDPPVVTWQSPPWQNNFTWVGTRYVGFRHGLDGDVEFIGQLDLTMGAVTGDVAFTLPTPWRAITFDFHFPIYMGGTEWTSGTLSVDSVSGDCTVYWPTSATAI